MAVNFASDFSVEDLLEIVEPEISLGPAHRFSEEHIYELPEGGSLFVENSRGEMTARGWDEDDLKVVVTKRGLPAPGERSTPFGGERRG